MLKLNVLCLSLALALSACGGKQEAVQSTPAPANTESTTPATGGDAQLDQEIDAGLAQMKSKLPLKIGDVMEISSVERSGKDINYTYTFLTDAVKKEAFTAVEGKKAGAQQLCSNPDTKKFLDAGYTFKFHYAFKDGAKMTVPFESGDC